MTSYWNAFWLEDFSLRNLQTKGVPLSFPIIQFLYRHAGNESVGFPIERYLAMSGHQASCGNRAIAVPRPLMAWSWRSAGETFAWLPPFFHRGNRRGNRWELTDKPRLSAGFFSLKCFGPRTIPVILKGLKMRCVNGVSDLGLRRQTPCPGCKRNRMPQTHFFLVRFYPRLYLNNNTAACLHSGLAAPFPRFKDVCPKVLTNMKLVRPC